MLEHITWARIEMPERVASLRKQDSFTVRRQTVRRGRKPRRVNAARKNAARKNPALAQNDGASTP
jgi:hypothetical protein